MAPRPKLHRRDEKGIDGEKLAWTMDLKNNRRGRIKEYVAKFPKAEYLPNKTPWHIPAQCAFPSATQNEVSGEDAKLLIKNGCYVVGEGANMPTMPEGMEHFRAAKLLYGPGKAANAGGVATSGLEMAQNSMRMSWTREEVDNRLKLIMTSIHDAAFETSKEYGAPGVTLHRGTGERVVRVPIERILQQLGPPDGDVVRRTPLRLGDRTAATAGGAGDRLEDLLVPVSTLFVPIFFVRMGLRVDLHNLTGGAVVLALALAVVAIIGKQACGLAVVTRGADRLTVGLGMIPRGEVGLIFAAMGQKLLVNGAPALGDGEYAAVVAMVKPLVEAAGLARAAIAEAAGAEPEAAAPGLDPEMVRAAVTLAVDAAMPALVEGITKEVVERLRSHAR